MLPGFKRKAFVKSYLKKSNSMDPLKEADFHKFTTHFLRSDGVFLLRLISQNAGDIITSNLTNHLWKNYQERNKQPKVINDDDSGHEKDNMEKFENEPLYV